MCAGTRADGGVVSIDGVVDGPGEGVDVVAAVANGSPLEEVEDGPGEGADTAAAAAAGSPLDEVEDGPGEGADATAGSPLDEVEGGNGGRGASDVSTKASRGDTGDEEDGDWGTDATGSFLSTDDRGENGLSSAETGLDVIPEEGRIDRDDAGSAIECT